MSEFARFWEAGGVWMYPIFGMGLLGFVVTLALGLLALLVKRPKLPVIVSTVLMAFGLAILLVGTLGWLATMRMVEEVVTNVNPEDRELILTAGRSEAKSSLILSLVCAFVPLTAGLALLGFGLTRLPRYNPPSGAPAQGTHRV